MPRGIPKQPRKNSSKKTTKKVAAKKATKRAYTRKAAEAAPALDNVTDTSPSPGIEVDARSFSASGMLDLNVRDRVTMARRGVERSVRSLVEASIDVENSVNATPAERAVLTARQRLAVAEFELAMGGLETAIRGH